MATELKLGIIVEKMERDCMDWCIKEEGLPQGKVEFYGSKFCIGNGYFGYRGTLEEYGKAELVSCTLSEVFDDNGNGWREPVNMPNGLYTYVSYKQKKLSVLTSQVGSHVQELWMDKGIHHRKTEFITGDGNQITVEASRMASLTDIHLLAMRYSVTANSDMELTIYTGIDDDIWNINGNHFGKKTVIKDREITGIVCETVQEKMQIAIGQKIKILSETASCAEEGTMCSYSIHLQAGVPFVMEKYVSICKETDCAKVWESAVKCCKNAEECGFDSLAEQQRLGWKERYERLGIKIRGDEEAEQAIYYSCYLLYSSAPFYTDRVAIPARGLSGQVYKGGMFWDTEIYMLPVFAFCEPEAARKLMMYRIRNLHGAREKAAQYGYKGAFYPWESQENGKDGCTHYNLTDIFTGRKMRTYFRDKQIHISADVVYGIWMYISVTKDYGILLEGGAEAILECARFFYSCAYFKKDKNRYEFLDVTGADEYHERINNDAYTNYMIHLTMKITLETLAYMETHYHAQYIELMDSLDYWGEYENIKDLYEKIYLPIPDKKGLIPQYDGYFEQEDLSLEELYSRIIKPNEYLGSPCGLAVNTQIIKQADVVLLLSLLSDQFSNDVREKNWCYYEPRTEHGSSLSTCIYALLAAKIGKTEWAYKFLMKAARIDLLGDYKLYLGDLYIGGTHPAANGGTWMVTVLGFAGLEVGKGKVVMNPHLPAHWELLEFSFQYAGTAYQVSVGPSEIEITVPEDGQELNVETGDQFYTCRKGITTKILY